MAAVPEGEGGIKDVVYVLIDWRNSAMIYDTCSKSVRVEAGYLILDMNILKILVMNNGELIIVTVIQPTLFS